MASKDWMVRKERGTGRDHNQGIRDGGEERVWEGRLRSGGLVETTGSFGRRKSARPSLRMARSREETREERGILMKVMVRVLRAGPCAIVIHGPEGRRVL
jgi:hypothetical protein